VDARGRIVAEIAGEGLARGGGREMTR
jgi:hypothetical protein